MFAHDTGIEHSLAHGSVPFVVLFAILLLGVAVLLWRTEE